MSKTTYLSKISEDQMNVQHDFPLDAITTLSIGGPAKYMTQVFSEEDLIEALIFAQQNKTPYFIIGGGSNLLISDHGLNALVIKNEISAHTVSGNTIEVYSGILLQDLVNISINSSLFGIHKLTGIPGTVGGALYGNAGAYGQTVSDFLVEVECIKDKKKIILNKKECKFSYRHSIFKDTNLIILKAKFRFPLANKQILDEESKAILEARMLKYKPGIKCPGSFFKNILEEDVSEKVLKLLPERKDTFGKIPAWLFLEEVGAKGQKKGKIEISSSHANLFINTGGGTAEDLWSLAQTYAQKVKNKFNIQLEPEVRLVNLPPIFPQQKHLVLK